MMTAPETSLSLPPKLQNEGLLLFVCFLSKGFGEVHVINWLDDMQQEVGSQGDDEALVVPCSPRTGLDASMVVWREEQLESLSSSPNPVVLIPDPPREHGRTHLGQTHNLLLRLSTAWK